MFGSAHSAEFNIVFCDGSVQNINHDIDAVTHSRHAHRFDRDVVDNSSFS
jgi:prepilin-type processing-associated H-X9-DG protein